LEYSLQTNAALGGGVANLFVCSMIESLVASILPRHHWHYYTNAALAYTMYGVMIVTLISDWAIRAIFKLDGIRTASSRPNMLLYACTIEAKALSMMAGCFPVPGCVVFGGIRLQFVVAKSKVSKTCCTRSDNPFL